jgi:parallel beta-helix repeat protein
VAWRDPLLARDLAAHSIHELVSNLTLADSRGPVRSPWRSDHEAFQGRVWMGLAGTARVVDGGSSVWARRGLEVCLAAMALSFAFGWSAQAARATHVSCGDTITTDTTLDSNLLNCPADGIVIGADDITLDRNGHTVDGDGVDVEPDLGIDNTAGHDGVTIRGGSIREFVEGVVIEGGRDNLVRDLSTSHQKHAGVVVFESSDVTVEMNTSFANVAGIVISRVSRVRVAHNSVSDSEFGGIPVYESDHVRVARNSVSGSGESGIYVFDSDHNRVRSNRTIDNHDGIQLEDSDHNRVGRNRTARNEAAGVFVQNSDRNVLRRNEANRNRRGGILTIEGSSRNVIARNRVSRGGDGIDVEFGQANLLARNRVVQVRHKGIWVGIRHGPAGGRHNLVRRNRVKGSGGDAFVVTEEERHIGLARNVATRAGNDGFDVNSRSAKLTRNRARRNGDLGIEAVLGVTDGGRNKASGNGDRSQCTNVFCG